MSKLLKIMISIIKLKLKQLKEKELNNEDIDISNKI